jgi:hypothetical protein
MNDILFSVLLFPAAVIVFWMIAFRNGFELQKEWFEEFEEEADVLVWQR